MLLLLTPLDGYEVTLERDSNERVSLKKERDWRLIEETQESC